MGKKLKAPFPYFGGKSAVGKLIWDRLGPVDNFVEPFAGSLAVLLLRPDPPRIETVNDADCMVANFWRATQQDPEAVAGHADWPVNEADLHARHRHLVLSDDAAEFRRRVRADPDYFDPRVAGWWCWGLCCWIGGGWCQTNATGDDVACQSQRPELTDSGAGRGVHTGPATQKRRPRVPSEGSQGLPGVCAVPPLSEPRPTLSGPGQGTMYGRGVHAKGDTDGGKRPSLGNGHTGGGHGVHSDGLSQQVPKLYGYASGTMPALWERCDRCHRTGRVPLRGPHARGCWATDLLAGRE